MHTWPHGTATLPSRRQATLARLCQRIHGNMKLSTFAPAVRYHRLLPKTSPLGFRAGALNSHFKIIFSSPMLKWLAGVMTKTQAGPPTTLHNPPGAFLGPPVLRSKVWPLICIFPSIRKEDLLGWLGRLSRTSQALYIHSP